MLINLFALVVKVDQLLEVLVTTLVFVFIGVILFAITYGILGLVYPIKKEIEEDHNTALGIVVGSIMIGIAIIIAAAGSVKPGAGAAVTMDSNHAVTNQGVVAVANANGDVSFTIDFKPWPQHARLTCRFDHPPADRASDESVTAQAAAGLDSLTWRLIEQTGYTMGLNLERKDKGNNKPPVLPAPTITRAR